MKYQKLNCLAILNNVRKKIDDFIPKIRMIDIWVTVVFENLDLFKFLNLNLKNLKNQNSKKNFE